MLRHYDQHGGGVKVYTREVLKALLAMSPAHEYIFLLAKSDRYYYDAEAIKEECVKTGTPGHLKGGAGAPPEPSSP